MPLEIKELHIRVTVNQPQPETDSPPVAQKSEGKPDDQALIQQCVEQVLEIFNNKTER